MLTVDSLEADFYTSEHANTADGLRRVRRDRDREGALRQRAAACPRGGGVGDAGEERVSRDDEPRDQDADERGDRHDRPPARHRPDGRAARVRRRRAVERRSAAPRHRRHPGLLEDRGRPARAGAGAVRSPRVRRGRARHRRAARLGEEHRDRVPRRRGGAGGNRGRRHPAAPGLAQPALERGQVHRGGRGRRPRRRRARRPELASPRAGRPRHRDRDPAGPDGPAVRLLQPGRRLDDAPLRRHRARTRDLAASRRADGRDDVGRERGGRGIDLSRGADRPGGRRAGTDRATRRAVAVARQARAGRRRQRDEP